MERLLDGCHGVRRKSFHKSECMGAEIIRFPSGATDDLAAGRWKSGFGGEVRREGGSSSAKGVDFFIAAPRFASDVTVRPDRSRPAKVQALTR